MADPSKSGVFPVAPGRRFELVGLGLLLVALALGFALWSFDPHGEERNLVGPAGQHLAGFVLGAVGVLGYALVAAAVLMAGLAIFGHLHAVSTLRMVSAGILGIGVCLLAQLLAGEDLVRGYPAGGLVGLVLCEALRAGVGPAGSVLTAVGAVLAGVLGLTGWSLARALRDGWVGLRGLVWDLADRIELAWAAREAARAREAELMEAARLENEMVEEEAARVRAEAQEAVRARVLLAATARAEDRVRQRLSGMADVPSDGPAVIVDPRVADTTGFAVYSADVPADAAQVIAEIDRAGQAGSDVPRSSSGIHVHPSDILRDETGPTEAWDIKSVVPQEVSESPRPSAPPAEERVPEPEDSSGPAEAVEDPDDSDVVIHERKEAAASFEDGDDSIEIEPPEPEKPVYQLPPINLLDYDGDAPEPVDQTELRQKATRLEEKLRTYGVEGRVTAIRPGPVVTTYEYQPAPGVKVAKIANLSDDIAMSMEAVRVRIVAPIPGRGVVGIELPNEEREDVYLKEVVAHERFKKSASLLTLALGKDAEGVPQVVNLAKMPHLLIAGTTGSGKSVSINTMILSILYKATPEQVKFIMVDPKMLELSLYNDIPHLLLPVVTDPKKASVALQWTVDEMERRYQLLSDMKVRDIEGFNKKLEKLREAREASPDDPPPKKKDPFFGLALPDPLPFIVVLIDEFADLMMVAPRDVEASVQRLAQKARAAGVHVLLATQRPSTDVITGVIKNNFPSRLSFRVASRHDSATVLNNPGAENLLGRGDSLYLSVTNPLPRRIHGGFVSESEVERVVEFWKAQATPQYDDSILRPKDEGEEPEIDLADKDEHYDMAVRIVTESRRASISALQRKLRVGYNRAARMIEMMEVEGVVGPAVGPKGEREVLVPPPPEG